MILSITLMSWMSIRLRRIFVVQFWALISLGENELKGLTSVRGILAESAEKRGAREVAQLGVQGMSQN